MQCNARRDAMRWCEQAVLDVLDVPESFPDGNPQRAIYCSRTLNLRSIKAIGAHCEGA